MRTSLPLLFTAVLLATTPAHGATLHTRVELILSATTVRPGDTVTAGIHLRMDPGWHTYWKNPGASGSATELAWQLPPGITAGEIQWPLPEKLGPDDLTTYIYQDEAVLLVPLKLATNLTPGNVDLKVGVTWLECQEACVRGSNYVTAKLEIGSESKPSANNVLLQKWEGKVPKSAESLAARAWWENSTNKDTRLLILEWNITTSPKEADLFPDASSQFEVQPSVERIPAGPGRIRISKVVKKYEGDWPSQISGVLVQGREGNLEGFHVTLPVGGKNTAPGGSTTMAISMSAGGASKLLWQMLLYAFIGGLILNIMPCVLPVIALKILGFVAQAKEESRRVRKLGLIYAAGVLISFMALAGIVIAVKAAGHKAGWGMQFSDTRFIVVLTVLVTLVALNLFGVFEVTLSGRVMDKAGGLVSRHGSMGAFFNGVLATALATPCTAPFLGVALGFAFAQSAPVIALMFLTIGIGLAAPYVILSWHPAWLKFLPKPGAWMEQFKMAMGFPMLATAVWLFLLASAQLGKSGALWFGLSLVVLALAAWVWGQFVQRGTKRRGLAMAVSLLLIGGSWAYAFHHPTDQIEWQPWSTAMVEQARTAGHPVFVDFTADWCLTCQVNKKTSIEIPSVRSKLQQIGAVTLLGDYTRFPDAITEELNHFGRAGVPLVLVYPRNAKDPPIVLPEILTPDIVLRALNKAAK